MAAVIVIGDEVTTTAFRLAGAEAIVPGAGAVDASLSDALAHGELVLITAAAAAELEPGHLERAVRRAQPPVLVIPDAALRDLPPDLAAAAERALGIAS